MTTATISKQTGLGLSTHYQVAGPIRLSNRDFLEEFHKIYHRQNKNHTTFIREHPSHDLDSNDCFFFRFFRWTYWRKDQRCSWRNDEEIASGLTLTNESEI